MTTSSNAYDCHHYQGNPLLQCDENTSNNSHSAKQLKLKLIKAKPKAMPLTITTANINKDIITHSSAHSLSLSVCISQFQMMLLLFLTIALNVHSYVNSAAVTSTNLPVEDAIKEDYSNNTNSWSIITRAEWGARKPTSITNFTETAPFVIIHHSYQPGLCNTTNACKAAMRSMQAYHMDGRKWPNIGYSFAIGGDGNVYEGCGYNVVGAHAPNYNSRSIGLLLIGNFVEKQPPNLMLEVAQQFLNHSMSIGKLQNDYVLYGHRQVRRTECPGDALYSLIQNWTHWRSL